MPLFDYYCHDCKERKEFLKACAASFESCPDCGAIVGLVTVQRPGFRTDHTVRES